MKKVNLFRVLCIAILLFCFTSCYNTRVAVGDASPHAPMIQVNSQRNHFLLGGLIPLGNARAKASDFVGDRENYVVRTNMTFVNGVVSIFTAWIYTPTTTTYYIPIDELNPSYNNKVKDKNNNNNYKDEDSYTAPQKRQNQRQNEPPLKEYKPITIKQPSQYERREAVSEGKNPIQSERAYYQNEEVQQVHRIETQTQPENKRSVIYFKNGAKMDGTIINSPNEDKIRIELPNGSKVEANRSDIERIEVK